MTDYNDGKIHGWNGGECPVHPKTKVRYWTLRSGSSEAVAERLRWSVIESRSGDIIAFQVITPYIEPVPPRECWSLGSMNLATEAEALDLRARAAEDNPGKGYEDMPIIRWREVKE